MSNKFAQFTAQRPLVLVGCGNMGAALLEGWLSQGMDANAVHIVDPVASPQLNQALAGIHREPTDFFDLMSGQAVEPAAIMLAVKPQFMAQAVEAYRGRLPADCLVISIAPGLSQPFYRDVFGSHQPLVRAMPNTPAAVGLGASLLCDLGQTTENHRAMAESLLGAVGKYAWVDEESKIDSLTGVTGSGPAYVFLLIEALAAAGVNQGFTPDQAQDMAKQVILGAATLAMQSEKTPATLRENVTSPGGVTKAALDVMMRPGAGMVELVVDGCQAGTARAKELGQG